MSERKQVGAAISALVECINWDQIHLPRFIRSAREKDAVGQPLTWYVNRRGWNADRTLYFTVKDHFMVNSFEVHDLSMPNIRAIDNSFWDFFEHTVEILREPVSRMVNGFRVPVQFGGDTPDSNDISKVRRAVVPMYELFDSLSNQPVGPSDEGGCLRDHNVALILQRLRCDGIGLHYIKSDSSRVDEASPFVVKDNTHVYYAVRKVQVVWSRDLRGWSLSASPLIESQEEESVFTYASYGDTPYFPIK